MRCDPAKPFAAPMVVPGVNAADDYPRRRLSVDGLKMFLWRASALLTATRVSADEPFGVPTQDPNLVDAATFLLQSQELSTPTFSADSLTLYAHFGGQGRDLIYVATRQSVTGKFGTPVPSGIGVGASAPTMYGDDPFISADGTSVYLDAGGDLYVATKTAGKFGTPAALRLVNTVGSSAGWETEPVSTADESKLYFASTRTDGNPKGKNDIWVSQRTSKSSEFGAPKLVPEINTPADDYPVWVSADDCEIFLDSYDPDSQTVEVFSSRRPM